MSEGRKRNVREDSRGNILKDHSWSNGPDSEDDQAGENKLLNENTVSPRFVNLSHYYLTVRYVLDGNDYSVSSIASRTTHPSLLFFVLFFVKWYIQYTIC